MPDPSGWWHPGHGCHDQITTELTAVQAQLTTINHAQEMIMSALTDLQSADAALKAEVATFLADVAAALTAEDPQIEQVVADINAEVSALQAADPASQTPPPPVGP